MKTILVAALLTSVAATSYAQAGQSDTQGYDQYRHVVLGYNDGAASPTTKAVSNEGPYARYLINNGFERADALAAAQRIGEQPRATVDVSETAQRPLTSYEAYEKVVLGQQIPSAN